MHCKIIIWLCFLSFVNSNNQCWTFDYVQCVDGTQRTPHICPGRTGLCVDMDACYWCKTESSEQCLSRNECDQDILTNTTTQCPNGYQASVNTWPCAGNYQAKIIGFSFLSLIPAVLYSCGTFRFFSSDTSARMNVRISVLSGIAMFILFVCTLVKQGEQVWAFLFFPSVVIPMGLLLIRAVAKKFTNEPDSTFQYSG